MRHGVIMAGGAGVRLWPLSRRVRPKQLLRLFAGKSLLRASYERVATLMPPNQIHIITARDHLDAVAAELPELPPENLIGEPVGRDTANAVALSAALLQRRDADAVIGVFTADHIIKPVDAFRACMERAFAAAEAHPDALVTLGIKPTRPDTNYGYVHRGAAAGDGLFRVRNFTEKPDAPMAEQYLSSGEYYWNSGMFVWRAATILRQIQEHLPRSRDAVAAIAAAWTTSKGTDLVDRLYPELAKISIDFAIMEKAPRVLVVEMDCEWLDVGAWPALASVVEPDAAGNVTAAENVENQDSEDNIIVCEDDHLIVTLGVRDLVIVRSPDATLVCHKDDTARIKELVEQVHRRYGDRYR